MTYTAQLKAQKFDHEEWKKYYYKTQKAYIRKRLYSIRLFYEGKSRPEIAKYLHTSYTKITDWIKKYLSGGFAKLSEPRHNTPRSPLTYDQRNKLKQIIIKTKPYDHGIDRNIWTGEIIGQIIKKEFGIELKKTAIYENLDRMGLSHQKAHRDYANADKFEQSEYVWLLKKSLRPKRQMKK